jgi:predicted phosphodiesterase
MEDTIIKHESGKFMAIGCTHGDLIDKDAFKTFMSRRRHYNPDHMFHLGDAFEFTALRKGATDDEKRISIEEDIEAGLWMFSRIFKGIKGQRWFMRGNHCFDEDTEVATTDGWKLIKDVELTDNVGQWEDGEISYANPLGKIRNRHDGNLICIEGAHTKQVVTGGHDVLVNGSKVKAASLVGKSLKRSDLVHLGTQLEDSYESLNYVRLLTWFVMDGTLVDYSIKNPKHTKCRLQWKLSKPRKIKRLRELLNEMGIEHTFRKATKGGVNVLQPYYITVYGSEARAMSSSLNKIKQLPLRMAQWGCAQFDAFLETLEETDGTAKDGGVSWVTVSKHDVDVVQQWATNCGHECSFKSYGNKSGFVNGKKQYTVSIRRSVETRLNAKVTEIPYKGYVHCLTMPKGTLITRRSGKIAITGNCERLWQMQDKGTAIGREFASEKIYQIETFLEENDIQMKPYCSRKGVVMVNDTCFMHGYGS